jgi:transcriptional regulator with XRE-family HTH domain
VVIVAVSEQIKILCVKLNISVSELARLSGKSPQAFGQRMKRESFTVDELKEIAEVAGCRYEGAFVLPNGERVVF